MNNARPKDDVLHVGRSLFIAGLPREATDKDIASLFDRDALKETHIVVDNITGQSKGYGFALFQLTEDAKKALDKMKEAPYMLYGKKLIVKPANKKEDKRGKGGDKKAPVTDKSDRSFSKNQRDRKEENILTREIKLIMSPTPKDADKLALRRLLIPFLKHDSDKVEKNIARTRKSLVGLKDGTKKKERRLARLAEYEKSLINFGVPGMRNIVTTDFCWTDAETVQKSFNHTIINVEARTVPPVKDKRNNKGNNNRNDKNNNISEKEFEIKVKEGVNGIIDFFNNKLNVYVDEKTNKYAIVQKSGAYSYPIVNSRDADEVQIADEKDLNEDYKRVYLSVYEDIGIAKNDTNFDQNKNTIIIRNIPFKATASMVRESLEKIITEDKTHKYVSPIIMTVKVPGSLAGRKNNITNPISAQDATKRNAGFAFAKFPNVDLVRLMAKEIIKVQIGDRTSISDACCPEVLEDVSSNNNDDDTKKEEMELNNTNYDEERESIDGESDKEEEEEEKEEKEEKNAKKKLSLEERKSVDARTVFVQNIPVSPPHMKLVKYIAEKRRKSLMALKQNNVIENMPEDATLTDMDAHYVIRLLQKKVSKLMSKFGPIEKVYMNVLGKGKNNSKNGVREGSVYDSSGVPTGTAFVLFKEEASAKRAIEASRILGNYRGTVTETKKKDGSAIPVIETSKSTIKGAMISEIAKRELYIKKDLALSKIITEDDVQKLNEKKKAPSLLIYGNRIFILPVLSRQEASKRSEERLNKKKEAVKRAKKVAFRERVAKAREERENSSDKKQDNKNNKNNKNNNNNNNSRRRKVNGNKRQFFSKKSPK